MGVNFGCDGAGDVIYLTSNHFIGISPSVLLPIDRLKSHYELTIIMRVIDADTKVNENDIYISFYLIFLKLKTQQSTA